MRLAAPTGEAGATRACEARTEARPWQRYVASLCIDTWDLGTAATQEVLVKIEALVTAKVLTEPAVALVLHRAGVSLAEADVAAPHIRMAVRA